AEDGRARGRRPGEAKADRSNRSQRSHRQEPPLRCSRRRAGRSPTPARRVNYQEVSMRSTGRIVDAWMQHPSPEFIAHPMFESLRRWSGGRALDSAPPLETTLASMDQAGVRVGMLCAWWGPQGPLMGNDEVAACVEHHPERLVGVA